VPGSAPDVPIAVVGAGIGGLTLGLALRRLGVAVQLFEQAPALTEVGAAVALAANGVRILSGLGLGERIAEVAVEPAALVHRHGIHGYRVAAVRDGYRALRRPVLGPAPRPAATDPRGGLGYRRAAPRARAHRHLRGRRRRGAAVRRRLHAAGRGRGRGRRKAGRREKYVMAVGETAAYFSR
jgi:phytoene dehydrogenase-like protein